MEMACVTEERDYEVHKGIAEIIKTGGLKGVNVTEKSERPVSKVHPNFTFPALTEKGIKRLF